MKSFPSFREIYQKQMKSLNKVARITVYFWIMKILATTLGETLGDLLSMTLHIGYLISLVITVLFFLVVLFLQLRASTFYPGLYWLVIVATTTAGTEVSDFMDRTLGLGYTLGSSLLFSAFIAVLYFWYRQEKSVVVYPVTSKRQEIFYWSAILFSNSLGTAFGDFLSDNAGMSYLSAALVCSGVIVIVALFHYFSRVNQVLLFWIAFIFTRPFGATFGDLLTKPISKGGLDLGTLPATLITAALLILVVFYSGRKDKSRNGSWVS